MLSGITPTINNIRLHFAKWLLANVNPLAPADLLRQLVFKVNDLEVKERNKK